MEIFKFVPSIPLLLVLGCTNPEVVYRTEYIKVEIPVVFKLERPDRPKFDINKSIPEYISDLITYTEILEVIIDNHNRGIKINDRQKN